MSSKNAIVYAVYSDKEDFENLLQWREIQYSVKTLREYNKDIDIKIYVAPEINVAKAVGLEKFDNVEVISLELPEMGPEWINKTIAKWLAMKWNAAFKALEVFKYDSVLMVDPDTVFQKNPQYIFEKYNDGSIYARPEDWKDFVVDFLKISRPVMNDGIVLIPKRYLKAKDLLLEQRNLFSFKLADEYRSTEGDLGFYWNRGIWWASFQYGISEYLNNAFDPVKYFDIMDVSTLRDFEKIPNQEERDEVCLIHYFSIGVKKFLPNKWLGDIDTNEMQNYIGKSSHWEIAELNINNSSVYE